MNPPINVERATVVKPVPHNLFDINNLTTAPLPVDNTILDLSAISSIPDSEFFKHRQANTLGDVSAKFGGDPVPLRGTKQLLRGIFNQAGIDGQEEDFDRLNSDLEDLNINYPERANSELGTKYQDDIRRRAANVLDAEDMKVGAAIKSIINQAIDTPGEFIDQLGDGILEDPTLPVMLAAGYFTGGRTAQYAARMGGFRNLITVMQNSKNVATRAAAVALNGTVDIAGAMAGDMTVGTMYEIAQNRAIGTDPMHNALETGAVYAALGGGMRGLSTAFKLIHGYPGKYQSLTEAIQDMQKRGTRVVPIIELLNERMKELPRASAKDELNAGLRDTIADNLSPFNMYKKLDNEKIKSIKGSVDQIYKEFKDDPRVNPAWLKQIHESKRAKSPVGTTGNNKIFYNLNEIVNDYRNNFRHLKGETQRGELSTKPENQARAEAFEFFNFKPFKQWLARNKGADGYANFLLRLEANKLKYMRPDQKLSLIYKKSLTDTLSQLGVDPRKFSKRVVPRINEKLTRGIKYAGRTAADVIKNPNLILEPVKDFILDNTHSVIDFGRDLIYGPVEGKVAFAKAHRQGSEILRDWEGAKLAGELAINDFANYVKSRLKTQDKLQAMSHYLEGNLEEFNKVRLFKNMPLVELSKEELKIAPSIRKFYDDILDWAQRSELFTQFRMNKNLYTKARGMTSHLKGQKLLDDVWKYVSTVDDPFLVARNISSLKQLKTGKGYDLKRRLNYVPHATKKSIASTDNEILGDILMDSHRASQLQIRSRFTKKRTYDTIEEAKLAGETLITEDISQLVSMYGRSMLRAQMNNRLLNQLGKIKSVATGKAMIGAKHEMPDYYVKFKHPNFKDVNDEYFYVNPNLAPDLRLYFDTSEPMMLNRLLQNIILISKRSALGLSLFHIMALAWSGLVTGQPVGQVMRNVLPLGKRFNSIGLKAIAGEEGYAELMSGIRNGLGVSVLEELKGDTLINAMRGIGRYTDEQLSQIKYLKPLGRSVNYGFKGLARTQEIIDTHLWDHVNTGLKATTYLTIIEKLIRNDIINAKKTGRPMTDMDLLRQRAAQFTNDAYGNQNWNQMAMNVQNHMSHRIAAALNKPSMRGYIRMLVFAPDWSFSNLRVMAKTLDIKDKAHSQYAAYALRSALLFAMVGETLQQTAGEGSIFDDDLKDALRPDLGGGKQIELSKQLSEVIRALPWVHGPAHVINNKLSTPVKSLMKTNNIGDMVNYWAESSIPISVRQIMQNPELGVFGGLGVPVYNK